VFRIASSKCNEQKFGGDEVIFAICPALNYGNKWLLASKVPLKSRSLKISDL
jgi:hypothetical protein